MDKSPIPFPYSWVLALVLALVAAIGFVVLVANLQERDISRGKDTPESYNPDKMEILEQLGSTSDLSESEKQSLIDAMAEQAPPSDVSAEAKLRILESVSAE